MQKRHYDTLKMIGRVVAAIFIFILMQERPGSIPTVIRALFKISCPPLCEYDQRAGSFNNI